MSESNTEYTEITENTEISENTEYAGFGRNEFTERLEKRRKERIVKQRRQRRLTLLALIIAFALLATMCGRDIVRLKAENRALKKQQAELEKQRDDLKEEVKRAGSKEYIREQARKQLRLLNPGEILFTFEDEDQEEKSGAEDE